MPGLVPEAKLVAELSPTPVGPSKRLAAPDREKPLTEKHAEVCTVPEAKLVAEPSPTPVGPSKTLATPDREEPQIEKHTDMCTTKRFRGTVRFFRGCFGWVTSDDVRTDRSVNPQGKSSTEIHNAIYLHKNDCDFTASLGMDVTFKLDDTQGKLKCMKARLFQEEARMDLDSYKERIARGKHRTDNKSKPKKERADSKPTVTPEKDGFQVWMEARKQASCKPQHLAKPLKPIRSVLSRSNVEFHAPASCSSSTAAGGLTSCSASSVDVSDFDMRDHSTTLDTVNKWPDCPRYAFPLGGSVSSCMEMEEPKQAQLIEEDTLDQPSVADNWEDADLDAIDVVLESKRVAMDNEMGACVPDAPETITASEQEPEPKKQSKTLALAAFLAGVGVEFDFDVVASTFGTDSLEEIILRFTDFEDFKSLVWAGMKPLHKNKLYRALALERRRRAMIKLASFLAEVGAEFDSDFVARTLGTDSLEEIIIRFTDIEDFESLVRAGMKPLHKNKLYRALALERRKRAMIKS